MCNIKSFIFQVGLEVRPRLCLTSIQNCAQLIELYNWGFSRRSMNCITYLGLSTITCQAENASSIIGMRLIWGSAFALSRDRQKCWRLCGWVFFIYIQHFNDLHTGSDPTRRNHNFYTKCCKIINNKKYSKKTFANEFVIAYGCWWQSNKLIKK